MNQEKYIVTVVKKSGKKTAKYFFEEKSAEKYYNEAYDNARLGEIVSLAKIYQSAVKSICTL